jgi:diacylglycerol kinase family enzyme
MMETMGMHVRSDASPLAAFVVNGTRARRVARLRARFAAAAGASGWGPPLILATTPEDSGSGAAAQALEAGASLVFAVGGDGTVRACAQVLAGTDVPLAIVPTGSANLTARALGVPRDADAALVAGFRGVDCRVDLARVSLAGIALAGVAPAGVAPTGVAPAGVALAGVDWQGPGDLICVAMAGIGVDAAVVGGTSERLKRLAGWPAYAAGSLVHLLGPPAEFTIRLDGGPPFVRLARSVVVGNTGRLPGGFPILPDARPDDGMLDVGILAPVGLVDWVSVGYRAILASRRDDSRLERHRARTVEIQATTAQPRQVDGEVVGPGASLCVSVLPDALRIRIPARSRERGGLRPA